MTHNAQTIHRKREKAELTHRAPRYIQEQWAQVLGAHVMETWRNLIRRVDRTPEALKKYGNHSTVPFSMTRLAENLCITTKTLRKHARILWDHGLVDFVEWNACGKFGKKPLNIVVYEYPQNCQALEAKPLKQVRDYAAQYLAGTFETYLEGAEKAAAASQAPKEAAAPPVIPEEAAEHPTEYIDLCDVYALFGPPSWESSAFAASEKEDSQAQEKGNAATHSNGEAASHMNGESTSHSNGYSNTHINISNTNFNNSNAINISNANFNSSSSLENNINIEVLEDEDHVFTFSNNQNSQQENKNESNEAAPMDQNLVDDILRIALKARNVSPRRIEKIRMLARTRGVKIITAEIIDAQLDHMAEKNNSSDPVRIFETYFINGIIEKIEDHQFYKTNTAEARHERKIMPYMPLDVQQQAAAPQSRPSYNWLEEREGA